MNPLTNIRNIAKLNEQELKLGIFDKERSWHNQYKDSAYIFIGGLPYDLTEGDVLCVFSQYGEIVNINLVRDKKTGKFKGYGFIAYEDQRSTILAVDNLNSAKLGGRTIRVDHVEEYRRPKADEKDETGKFQEKEEAGCAPQTPPESSTGDDDDDDDDVNERETKAKKRKKKEKKKRKKEGKQKRDKESKLEIKKELDEDELFDRMLLNKHIKKEKEFTSGATARHRDDVTTRRKCEDVVVNRSNEDIEERARKQDRPHHNRDRITDKDKHSFDEERSRGRVQSPRRDRRDRDRQMAERPDNRSSKYRTRSRSRSRSRNRNRSRSPLRRR